MGNVFSTPPPDGKPVLTVHQSLLGLKGLFFGPKNFPLLTLSLADLEQRFKERGNVEGT